MRERTYPDPMEVDTRPVSAAAAFVTPKIERVYLDIDGVMADFVSSAAEVFRIEYEPHRWPENEFRCDVVFGIAQYKFWREIDRAGTGFWLRLLPFPHNDELRELATLFAAEPPVVCTSPSKCPTAYHGKSLWLLENGWKLPHEAFFCSEKHHLAKPGRVLIDDNPAQCEAWDAAGGSSILFPAPWNARRDLFIAGDAMRCVRDDLERISGREFGGKVSGTSSNL